MLELESLESREGRKLEEVNGYVMKMQLWTCFDVVNGEDKRLPVLVSRMDSLNERRAHSISAE